MEKKYFRIECSVEHVSALIDTFDPDYFFQITLLDRPNLQYFVFGKETDLVIARGYAKVNQFPYRLLTRDEFQRLNPPRDQFLQKGSVALSPWLPEWSQIHRSISRGS